ncbi:hypothetical protein TNCV_3590401 [Trichonephila clavipes]|nr:hypothetical protein TNCV_3590401 [Trichonephila clavipes]
MTVSESKVLREEGFNETELRLDAGMSSELYPHRMIFMRGGVIGKRRRRRAEKANRCLLSRVRHRITCGPWVFPRLWKSFHLAGEIYRSEHGARGRRVGSAARLQRHDISSSYQQKEQALPCCVSAKVRKFSFLLPRRSRESRELLYPTAFRGGGGAIRTRRPVVCVMH